MTTDTTEATKIEQIIKVLDDKRQHLNVRAVKLADERGKISFNAHANGDQKAKARLEKIHLETATLASEAASIESAIVEANTRLAAAKRDEAQASDKVAALAVRETLVKFVEAGVMLDDALVDVADNITDMIALLNQLHALGQSAPTSEQFRVNGTLAIKSMLQKLPQLWVRDFEFQMLAPNQRKQFKDLCAGWSRMIEGSIHARLGFDDQQETKKEVA
jgi:hypothetical protein